MAYEDEVRANLFAYMDGAEKRIRKIGWCAFAAGLSLGILIGLWLA